MAKLARGCEEGIVLFEDQQKINLFAKKNALLNDLKEQITNKEKEFQNFEDASDELMMLDDDELISYEMGEVFVLLNSEDVQKQLDNRKIKIDEELVKLRAQSEEIDGILKKVKSQLYAKFGNNINLEAPES